MSFILHFQDAHEDAIAARLAGMMKKQGLEETFMQAFSEGGGQSHLLSPGAKMDGSRLDKVNSDSFSDPDRISHGIFIWTVVCASRVDAFLSYARDAHESSQFLWIRAFLCRFQVPCAGGDGRQADLTCLEAGVLQCARCKMVAYCSKVRLAGQT